jgi:hypothetical protein
MLHMDGEKLAGDLSTAETINLDSDGEIREVEGRRQKLTPLRFRMQF